MKNPLPPSLSITGFDRKRFVRRALNANLLREGNCDERQRVANRSLPYP